MKKQLIRLMGVRSIITLALTGVLCYGFITKAIDSKDFLVYVTMVFTFFFAKQTQEEVKQKETTDEKGGVG